MVDAITNSAPAASRDAETQARSLEERMRQNAASSSSERDESAKKPRGKRRVEGLALPQGLIVPLPLSHQLGQRKAISKTVKKNAGRPGGSGQALKTAKSVKSAKTAKTESNSQSAINSKTSINNTKPQAVADSQLLSVAVVVKEKETDRGSADKEPEKMLPHALSTSAHSAFAPTASVKETTPMPPRPLWAQPAEMYAESTSDRAGLTFQFKSLGAGHAVNVQRTVGEDGQVGFLLQPSSAQVEQHLRDHPQMPQDAYLMGHARDQQGQSGQDPQDQDQAQDEDA